jgi:hypothetical protein
MALVLKINTVDRSSWVDWKSVTKDEGLTKEPDTLAFNIKETPSKTIPAVGATVQLLEDAVKIFEGTIVDRRSLVIGGVLKGYSFVCKDLVHEFDKTLVSKAYNNEAIDDIVADIVSTFTSGFTTANVETGLPTIDSVRFNYEQPSKCLQKLADLIGYDWYIDYDGDIHFFNVSNNAAPFDVEDDNGKVISDSLNFDQNIIELRNSVIIRGGEYLNNLTDTTTPDLYEADGNQRVFTQIYRYSNVEVTVAGVAKTVGIDNIDNPASFDCLYNYTEKAIKFPEASKPTAGQIVKVFGDAHIPLIAKVRDQISISTYGEYQGLIVDKTIESIDEAHTRAKAELTKWADGAYSGGFRTTQTGLKTGQYIRVNSALFGVDSYFKINRITARANNYGTLEYTVKFLASGELTFADIMVGLLSKDRQNISVADDEVIQRLEVFPETVTLVETSVTATKTSPPYKWGVAANDFDWNFGTWS